MTVEIKVDSHKKSLSEAFINSFGSYPIGYGLGIVILEAQGLTNLLENHTVEAQ